MLKTKMCSNFASWNYRWKVDEDILEEEKLHGFEFNKEETLTYLFGDYDTRPATCLDLYLYTKPDKTAIHRLNMLWAYPVTLFCSPYRFIRYGGVGWTNKTGFGKFILKCVGEDS